MSIKPGERSQRKGCFVLKAEVIPVFSVKAESIKQDRIVTATITKH